MKNKRYYVFAGEYYYPCGGMADLRGSVNELDEVHTLLIEDDDWVNVLDIITGEEVEHKDIPILPEGFHRSGYGSEQ